MIPQKKDQKPKNSSQQIEEEENHLMNSISTSLHNFKITLTLGRGAGSCVFLIEEYKSGSLYALKTITKQSQYYTNNINRIKNEYNLHSQLDHPNIVKILKRFEDNEYVYMMLEYCPGGSLFDYVKSKGREICSREKYGIQSDCWSFGCILYTIATGRPPFETVSIQQTLKMLQKKNKVEYPSHLSKPLIDLIDHILDWNQDTRYNISQIKNHPFYNKFKQNYAENEYKLQNPMTFAPPQTFQMEQSVNMNNFNKSTQQGHNRQRSNFSMDSSNNSKINQQNKIINDNLQFTNVNRTNQIQENNVFQSKQTKENRLQSKEQLLINENKENIHSNILNSINQNQQKQFQSQQQQKQNPIPLQKSYSYNQKNEQKQEQLLYQTTAQGLKKETSEQNMDSNRNKQIIQEIQNISQNSYYNPQISQSNKQQQQQIDTIQSKPQSKTILNTFLNKATKSNSLHQSSSTTPSNNQQILNQNNFFQSQKSYKNPIVQILNGFPNDTKIQQNQVINHQKNKSFDISGIIPPQPPRPRDEQKNQLNIKSINQENNLKKQVSLDQSNQNEFVSTPSGNNKMFSQSSNNMIFMKDNNNSKIQNIKKKTSLHYPSEQTNMAQEIISTNTTCRSNMAPVVVFPSPSSQQFMAQNNNNNHIAINQNIQRLKSSKSTHNNNDNSHTSFDISQLKLDSSQMNSFSVERDFQSTAQFSSKSNVIHTPTNVSISQKPPSNKNSQTYRDINPLSFAPSQQSSSLLRAKGSSKEYIKTEPCDIDVNQTPRLECLETENNENTSTAACSKYSMNTTNRSFNKGLNTSKSFSSFIAEQTNENDKSTNNIQLNQQSSNAITSQISPVKVGDDLDVSKIKTKNGYIEITPDHSLLVESCNGRLLFKISKDGQKIQINKLIDKPMEKHYTLNNLPAKYFALYGYAKQVINALKTKKVISKLENKEGVFILLENNCFEAQFKTGYKIYYKNKSGTMKIKAPDTNIYEISLEKNSKDFPQEVKSITTKSLKYYEYLLNQNKEFQNI
ncbi:hypothetical protein ABPG74_016576 [Tetrahymena malaccensis]